MVNAEETNLRVLILLLLMAGQAYAGPWPRGKGKVFYSAHINGEYAEDTGLLSQFGTLYAEYGLTEKITLGVDYSGSEIRTDKAVAFVRIPLFGTERRFRYAAELGVGLVDGDMALRPGFSIGKGVSLGKRNGWMTLDTRIVLKDGPNDMRVESDFTFGLNLGERSKLIAQLQAGLEPKGSDYVKFAPSYVFERKPGHFWELGLVADITGGSVYGAKLGIWREF